jgi:hypothetical protein
MSYSYNQLRIVYTSLFLLFTLGCKLNNPQVDPTEDYFRIFDIDTEVSYEAHDIEILGDGYLIYGTAIVDSSTATSLVYNIPYFLKTNEAGIVEWDTTFLDFRDNRDENRRIDNSHKQLTRVGNSVVFTGYPQDEADNQIRLLSFDISTKQLSVLYTFDKLNDRIEAIDIVKRKNGIGFYASASQCFNGVGSDKVRLFYFDDSGALIWDKELADTYICSRVGENSNPTDIYQDIGYLQTQSGKEYVYVKTIVNEDVDVREFNLVFADANTGEFLFSNLYNGVKAVFDGTNSVLQTGMPILVYTNENDSLRLATVNFTTSGTEIFYPNIEINTNSFLAFLNENEFSFNELLLGTPILIQDATVDGVNFLLYAGTNREGRTLIAAFDKETGRLYNKKYFGYNSYYEVGAITQTDDQGLIIVGHTITTGRFQQLSVVKISQGRLAGLLKID